MCDKSDEHGDLDLTKMAIKNSRENGLKIVQVYPPAIRGFQRLLHIVGCDNHRSEVEFLMFIKRYAWPRRKLNYIVLVNRRS